MNLGTSYILHTNLQKHHGVSEHNFLPVEENLMWMDLRCRQRSIREKMEAEGST
jgi:hypothetical protein